MNKGRFRTFFIIIASLTFFVFLLKSFSPFGLKAIYNFSYPKSSFIKNLLNLNYVSDLGKITNQSINYLELNDEMAKFTLEVPPSPRKISKAKVFLDFKTDKEARIGILNDLTGEIENVTFYEPVLQKILWQSISDNELSLFQKNKKYERVDDFISDPNITNTDGQNIGIYDYELKPVISDKALITGNFQTDSKLRGAHTMYVYVNNSSLKLEVSKVDLNQYYGSDEVNIFGFYDDVNVFYTKIDDDGIKDKSTNPAKIQSVTLDKKLKNGIYKILIDAGIDSVISNIKINQGLVVFDDLFFVDNPAVYPIVSDYKTNTVYTDADRIDFALAHESQKQNIKIDNDTFLIDEKNKSINLNRELSNIYSLTNPKKKLSMIRSDINDIRISTESVFSFSQEAFFKPRLSSTVTISPTTDISSLEYIIGKYKKAVEKEGWYHQDLEIPISQDILSNNELKFSIYTNDRSNPQKKNWLKIKNLKITLE